MHISGCFDNENGAPVPDSFVAGDVLSNREFQSAMRNRRHPKQCHRSKSARVILVRTPALPHQPALLALSVKHRTRVNLNGVGDDAVGVPCKYEPRYLVHTVLEEPRNGHGVCINQCETR